MKPFSPVCPVRLVAPALASGCHFVWHPLETGELTKGRCPCVWAMYKQDKLACGALQAALARLPCRSCKARRV